MTDRDRVLLYAKLAALLRAGVAVDRSFTLLGRHAKDAGQRTLLEAIGRAVGQGRSLSTALEAYPAEFPAIERKVIAVGESQNRLPAMLDRIGKTLETRYRWRLTHRADLIYGVLLISMALAAVVFLQTVVVEQFGRMFEEMGGGRARLPGPTQLVIAVSSHVWLFLGTVLVIILLAVAVFMYRRQWCDRVLYRFPIVGASLSLVDGILFCRTVELGLAGGVSVTDCLNQAALAVRNTNLQQDLRRAASAITQGETLGPQMEGIRGMPTSIADLIVLGEARGELVPALQEGASVAEQQLNARASLPLGSLTGIVVAVLFLWIAFSVIALYLPIFYMASVID